MPEFDCLYLDMNGIIHKCTHPADNIMENAVMTEKEMFLLIFKYIDDLFSIIKPQRYFLMAVDGCAPRAKMNQQRARRYRAARDREEAAKQAAESQPSKGAAVEEPFDSNCITPGTEFMHNLSMALEYYVHQKIQTDALWQYHPRRSITPP